MKANPLSFENTEQAFAYKSDKDLKKAGLLLSSMRCPLLVRLGTAVTPLAIRAGMPVTGLIRNTLFQQFVGGETLEETSAVAAKIGSFGVKVILDYGVEGKQGEESFDHSCDSFIRVIEYAAAQPGIPFISIKVTGFARFGLLEKLDAAATEKSGYSGKVHTEALNEQEQKEWQRVVQRMDRIIGTAARHAISVLVDAEETWIQDPVDAVTMQMMQKYNKERPVVYNTIQLYRHDRLSFLKETVNAGKSRSFIPAVKLVRGAYMEKERRRAAERKYPSPIQSDKAACDRDYNAAVQFSIEHIDELAVVIATHNEHSNLLVTQLMERYGIAVAHPRIHFSQLYGMSDHITFNLAGAGYSVSKYLPFGPIREVIPYLMRRAQENSSIAGQTGRELKLIRKELRRRRHSC